MPEHGYLEGPKDQHPRLISTQCLKSPTEPWAVVWLRPWHFRWTRIPTRSWKLPKSEAKESVHVDADLFVPVYDLCICVSCIRLSFCLSVYPPKRKNTKHSLECRSWDECESLDVCFLCHDIHRALTPPTHGKHRDCPLRTLRTAQACAQQFFKHYKLAPGPKPRMLPPGS